MRKPKIFVSAVTRELISARKLVCETLERIGYNSDRQDIFGTEAGDLRAMLRRKIDNCDGLIQIVGASYGAEPTEVDPQYDRVSYTQFEAKYAKKKGKPVWYIFISEQFPVDVHPVEPAELRDLQAAYRAQIRTSGDLRHPATNRPELTILVYQLRDHVAEIEKRLGRAEKWTKTAIIAILFGLAGIGGGVWLTQARLREQQASIRIVDTNVRELSETPSVSTANLVGLLASADATQLKRFGDLHVSTQQFEIAMSQIAIGSRHSIARQFFEKSRGSQAALQWLKDALILGLDPDLQVDDAEIGRHGMLIDALDAGNAPAILALLGAGASPHAYEDIWLRGKEYPIFLFPYIWVEQSAELTSLEKRQVLEAMQSKCGMPNPLPKTSSNDEWTSEEEKRVDQSNADAAAIVGHPLQSIAATSGLESPLLKAASRRTGFDWPSVVKGVPTKINIQDGGSSGLRDVEIFNLIGISQDKAYFLARAQTYRISYSLAEVSKDGCSIRLYVYMSPAGGMGICHCDEGETTPPQDCWRRWDFSYNPATHSGKLQNYYDFTAETR